MFKIFILSAIVLRLNKDKAVLLESGLTIPSSTQDVFPNEQQSPTPVVSLRERLLKISALALKRTGIVSKRADYRNIVWESHIIRDGPGRTTLRNQVVLEQSIFDCYQDPRVKVAKLSVIEPDFGCSVVVRRDFDLGILPEDDFCGTYIYDVFRGFCDDKRR